MRFKKTFYDPNQTWRKIPEPYEGNPGTDIYMRAGPTQPSYITRNVDFNAIKAKKLSEEGLKVSLSDKTVKELVKAEIPDPKDKELAKKENREPKKISITADLVNNNLKLANKIDLLRSAVDQKLYASDQQVKELLLAMYRIIEKAEEENNNDEFYDANEELFEDISELNLPEIDLPRFIGLEDYNDNAEAIKLWVLTIGPQQKELLRGRLLSKLSRAQKKDLGNATNPLTLVKFAVSNGLFIDTMFYTIVTEEEVAEDEALDTTLEQSGIDDIEFETEDEDS